MYKCSIGNNQTVYIHPLDSEFVKFIKTWKKPEFQRNINEDRISTMIKIQEDRLKKDNQFLLGGTFELCRLNNNLYLVDGQHRREVLLHFFKKKTFKDVSCIVRIKDVSNEKEIFEWFQFVNESTPVEIYEKKETFKQANFVLEIIKENWSEHLSEAINHHCNKINLVRFGNFLTNFGLLQPTWSKEDAKLFIFKVNSFFKDNIKLFNLKPNQLDKCNNTGFYLGIYVKLEKDTRQIQILNDLNKYLSVV